MTKNPLELSALVEGDLQSPIFLREVYNSGFKYVRARNWNAEPPGRTDTDAKFSRIQAEWIISDRHVTADERDEASGRGVGYIGDSLIMVRFDSDGELYCRVADNDESTCLKIIDDLMGIFPEWEPEPKEDSQTVPIAFWSMTQNGPTQVPRYIAVPKFDEVESNYPLSIKGELDEIMDWSPWPKAGKLMLWHGDPGTGKTFALRSLCWEWRKWAKINYIVDPEVFLADPSYMMQVLMGGAGARTASALLDAYGDDDESRQDDPWHFIILEDAGELMAADARDRTGQGLSRLLNVADGLLGQGLKVCLLITTNEPLKKLHPAIERPGRCAANIEFRPFTADEGRAWLEGQGVTPNGEITAKDVSLAKLFAIHEGRAQKKENKDARPVGFAI